MLQTPLCGLLNIEVPIICAPMGPHITSLELAAAVSNAGGLGIISFGGYPPPLLRQEIRRLRSLTGKPFGVNLLLQFPIEEHFNVCVDERVPVVSFFWGDPSPYVERAHAAGIKVVDQVGSVEAAERSAGAGVDVIIAQGVEAGGHIAGQVSTMALVPRVVDAVSPVPVAAAGGIADARGLVAALALGAEGVVIGTRFLATPEAAAHPVYKQKVLDATEEDTVRTTLFGHGWPNAPHRALRTAFVNKWLKDEARGSEQRADEPVIGETVFGGQRVPLLRFMGFPPSVEATGDIESMGMLAGQGVGLVSEIKPAALIVRELVEGARQIIEHQLSKKLAGL
ncbi:MAG TPA: nitronate monooxygenase [Pyrinomonadaceae bacterium]|nr:nitronate monooxygenase [Pyrinomonadaceae bacterium]